MTSSPTGGWAFASPHFDRRQELSALERERVEAYEMAAATEAQLQADPNGDTTKLALLIKQQDHWYAKATEAENKIRSIREETA